MIEDMVVILLINKIIILFMDHNFQMKDILTTEGKIPVNDKWVKIDSLVTENKYICIICLIITFQGTVLF